jgi:hypothetical protein
MKSRRLLIAAFLFAVILIFLYQVSDAFWGIRWFDSLMHFLGGLTIGTFSLWVWFISGLFGRKTPSKKEAFVAALIFAMLAGVWWEFFEYAYGIAHPIGSYALDTFHDCLADFVGGMAAGLLGAHRSFYE